MGAYICFCEREGRRVAVLGGVAKAGGGTKNRRSVS